MSDPVVNELRALLEKATPGPWEADYEPGYKDKCDNLSLASIGGCGCCQSPWAKVVDVELIVAAINALPALMDELEAARAKLEAIDQRARRLLESNPGAMIWPNDAAYAVWGSDWEAVLKGAPVRVDD